MISVRVTSNKLPNVARNTPTAIAKRMKKGAELIREGAARRSRVDTGEMKEGWRIEGGGSAFFVMNDVEHTEYNEYGTRFMTAQPMARPAADEVMAKTPELFADIEGDLIA